MMTKTITEFWTHEGKTCGRTVGDDYRILQFRNAKGLLTTEKWTFADTLWVRLFIRQEAAQ